MGRKKKTDGPYEKMMAKYKKTGKQFIGYYSGYATSLDGETIIDAIKYFYSCYNAILTAVADMKNNILYVGKKNDKPDIRGYYKYSYYNGDEKVFDCNELTRPLTKIKPSKFKKDSAHGWISNTGVFYECGFEGHNWLADELFITKTVELKPTENKYTDKSRLLEGRRWIKISSDRIHYDEAWKRKPNQAQIKALLKYLAIRNSDSFKYHEFPFDKKRLIEKLNDAEN